MEQFFPMIFVVGLVAFILIKQINHTANSQNKKSDTNGFEKYSKFSVIIQNHIRAIKLDIDSSKSIEEPRYKLLDKGLEEEMIETLSDYLRKLVFFETLLAKNKTTQEIENGLFEVLNNLDVFLKQNFKDGDFLAEELKNDLSSKYEG